MIRAAVVGLGWWGRTLIRGAEDSGRIEIVAGATGRRTLAEEVAREQGFALKDTYEDVLADPAVQAVILATPHLEHEAQVIAAARAGKHIFCEKPFTLSKESADRAVAAVRQAGVILGLGHNRRFHPNFGGSLRPPIEAARESARRRACPRHRSGRSSVLHRL